MISQIGLMFFPAPVAGVREARRVLRPGGRFAARHFPDRRDGLLRGTTLGAPGRLGQVIADAGLRDVRVDDGDTERSLRVESGAIRTGFMLRELPPQTRRTIRDRIGERTVRFAARGGLEMPSVALVGSGVA